MNKIHELFNGISDTELKSAITEMMESEQTGLIKEDGVVRKYAKLTGEITGLSTTDFFMIQNNLLKQAAFRWVTGTIILKQTL